MAQGQIWNLGGPPGTMWQPQPLPEPWWYSEQLEMRAQQCLP